MKNLPPPSASPARFDTTLPPAVLAVELSPFFFIFNQQIFAFSKTNNPRPCAATARPFDPWQENHLTCPDLRHGASLGAVYRDRQNARPFK